MKLFWKFGFPVLFGLLIYASIRLVTDTSTHERFWTRPASQNMIEIVSVIIMSFVFEMILRYAVHRFNKRKMTFTSSAVVMEFALLLLVCTLFINPAIMFIHYLARDPIDWADITIANIIVLLYVLLYYAISRGNSLVRSYVEQQTQIEHLKAEGLETELKFLKSQYHPHFLFNALNTIYFQMDENLPAAKKTIEKFAELLRYQLYDQQQMVAFCQELQHLQNFIHLQKARTSEKLKFKMDVDESLSHEKIYPLLLLPLVENAFKHVGAAYEITINVSRCENFIYFKVENSISNNGLAHKSGIGLENLRRRLQLLYPSMHEFIVTKSNDSFQTILKLPVSNELHKMHHH